MALQGRVLREAPWGISTPGKRSDPSFHLQRHQPVEVEDCRVGLRSSQRRVHLRRVSRRAFDSDAHVALRRHDVAAHGSRYHNRRHLCHRRLSPACPRLRSGPVGGCERGMGPEPRSTTCGLHTSGAHRSLQVRVAQGHGGGTRPGPRQSHLLRPGRWKQYRSYGHALRQRVMAPSRDNHRATPHRYRPIEPGCHRHR